MHSRSTQLLKVSSPEPQQLRFVPIMHLESGEQIAELVEARVQFTETAMFGPAALLDAAQANPAKWLAEQIEDVAAAARLLDVVGLSLIHI